MKDKIKEILDYAKNKGYIDLDYEESKQLLDYITNLQKENEKLKSVIKNHSIIIPKTKISDYKSRIYKAVDNIKHELYGHIKLGDEESWNEEFYTDDKLDYRKLLISILETTLKTLQGEDKNGN